MSLKVLSPLTLITGSTPSTPPAGYGAIFASASSVYFKDSSGTVKDLAATGGGSVVYTYFTESGIWYKPAGITAINVIAIGAGGGGGSGAVYGPGSTSTSGGGGGSGAIIRKYFSASELLTSSYHITIGAGGTGGAGRTIDTSNGLAGSAGTATTFVSQSSPATTLISARFGGGGGGGTNSTIPAGTGGSIISSTGGGGTGGVIGSTAASTASPPTASYYSTCASAFGGTITSLNTRTVAGAIRLFTSTQTIVSSSTDNPGDNGPDGTPNIDTIFFASDEPLQYGIGFAGLGSPAGSIDGTIGSGRGGSGSSAGAGGGPSGGVRNGADSGNGGPGGNGLLIVVEYY